MAEVGLTDEDGWTQAWFVTATGEVSGGAEAINRALRHVGWAKPFTYLYPLPIIRQLQDRAYRWVANNRYRLPGSTAACEVQLPDASRD